MATPWMKFYPTDWQSDPALRMCSLTARGLWIEMIALMHKSTPYGHLLINGQRPTDAQLAVLVGALPDQIAALLGELESAGVFSRTKEGTIYSRRLSRDAKKAATARKNGLKGGNPSLSKTTENPPLDKGGLNGWDKTQKPEARSQSKEKEDAYASSKKKGSRLPSGWSLPDEWRDEAVAMGVPIPIVHRQAEMFRDYWIAKPGRDGTKLDWQATWRNWIRRAADTSGPKPQQPAASSQVHDERMRFLKRVAGHGAA